MGVRGRKLDITPSEMMELRKQGYSNGDIAQMLDIGKSTMQRYIGKQGCRIGHLAAFEDKLKNKAIVAPAEPAIPTYVPKITRARYKVSAEIDVEIDHIGETLNIESPNGDICICITFDEARELVRFLAWASDKCKPTKEENENEDNA